MKRAKLLLVLLVLGVSFVAKAQKFEVAPTRIDFNLELGQNGQSFVNVKNHANKKKKYTVTLSDWTVSESGDIKYLPANTSPRSCADWITITPAVFELQPNESTKISVVMRVPNKEEAQTTKWGMLFVQEVEEQSATAGGDKSTKAGIKVNPSIGVYLLQAPDSYNNESATIDNMHEKEKGKSVEVDVANTGDKILKSKVYLIVSDLQTADEITMEPIEVTLLPGVKKSIVLQLPETMKAGNYSLTGVLDYSPNQDLEGVVMDYTVEKKEE
ncbi:DUF916 domain-containing protein [Prolixibacteraceae bacterium JC049]|nr:DUF916 domain-containing protein [Prolixibacteraceae bacterium JC049]